MRSRPLVALLLLVGVGAGDPQARDGGRASAVGTKATGAADGVHQTTVPATLSRRHADHCPHDNLLRCFIRSQILAYTFCSWSVGIYPTPVTVYETVSLAAPVTATVISSPGPSSSTSSPASSSASSPPLSPPSSLSTVTTTETERDTLVSTSTVVSDHTQTTTTTATETKTQTTTDTVVSTVSIVTTVTLSASSLSTVARANGTLDPRPTTTTATTTTPPPSSALLSPRTSPEQTSLACLADLRPDALAITSACGCFSEGLPLPTVTATVTLRAGAPTCAGGQPTFPDCFADFHPYNCGTDHVGQIACSCAATTEGTAQCTLGDYERDNACLSSDDCADGWFCTAIDCFGDGVDAVCTQACPVLFRPGEGDGGNEGGSSNGADDFIVPLPGDAGSTRPPMHSRPHTLHQHNLSIVIVHSGPGPGRGRAQQGV